METLVAGQMVTRKEISDALVAGFGIKQGERMVRYALEALGLEPVELRSRKGEPGGPQALFDPLALWTIASVYHRRRHSLKPHSEGRRGLLVPYRAEAKSFFNVEQAVHIPQFLENLDFAAQLLLLGSPDMGMDPVHRREHVREHPWLMSWCSEGEEFFMAALAAWDNAYFDLLRAFDLDQPLMRLGEAMSKTSTAIVIELGDTLYEAQQKQEQYELHETVELQTVEVRVGRDPR